MLPFVESNDETANDANIGRFLNRPSIVVGEQALIRRGLTTLVTSALQLSTLYCTVNFPRNPICTWYFSPWADKYDHTTPSPEHPNILEPTRERALWEYIILRDDFDEGILIEGIKTYLDLTGDDESKLIEEARYWGCGEEEVKYWVNEARNDYEV